MLMIIASYIGLILFIMAAVFMACACIIPLFLPKEDCHPCDPWWDFSDRTEPPLGAMPWPTKEMLTLGGEWQMWDEDRGSLQGYPGCWTYRCTQCGEGPSQASSGDTLCLQCFLKNDEDHSPGA